MRSFSWYKDEEGTSDIIKKKSDAQWYYDTREDRARDYLDRKAQSSIRWIMEVITAVGIGVIVGLMLLAYWYCNKG